MFRRLRNLWRLSLLSFDASTSEGMEIYDKNGNKIKLAKKFPTIKKRMAIIIPEKSKLEESIIDEGGDIE